MQLPKTNIKLTKRSTRFQVSIQFILDDLPTQLVAVSVCGPFGLWPFRSLAFRFVAVPVCGRFGFGRFGLWPLWPETIRTNYWHILPSPDFESLTKSSNIACDWLASPTWSINECNEFGMILEISWTKLYPHIILIAPRALIQYKYVILPV